MLFDFQGKRRRVIQVVFSILALVFVLGFVGFGVGSNIAGDQGLSGIFGNGGGGDGNSLVQKRVDRFEKQLTTNPRSTSARAGLVRGYYQLANDKADENGNFPDDAKDQLRRADVNWRAYLKLAGDKPDASLAGIALQIYGPTALNDANQAKETAQLIASAQPSAQSYLNLASYATQAKDQRTADLAGQKAVDLAPKAQRAQVRTQLKQIKAQAKQSSKTQQAPAQ